MNNNFRLIFDFPSSEGRNLFLKWLNEVGYNDFNGFFYLETEGEPYALDFSNKIIAKDFNGTTNINVMEVQI